jgi:hypothetical protein
MSKHVLDRDRGESSGRAEHFAEIERQTAPEGSDKAAQAAHRRPQGETGARTGQFARVERGDEV